MKRIAGSLVLCAFGALCASGGTWQSVDGEWNGAFSDARHWNGGLAADGGENSVSAQSHDVTVSVDSATETTARLMLTGYAERPAVLDVTGASLLFVSQAVDGVTWPANAFYGRFDGYSFFQDKSEDERWNKQAQAKLSDVAVKIWSPEAGVAEMLVTGGANGVFDFEHPDPRRDTKGSDGARPTVTLFQADYYQPNKSTYNHARLKFVDTEVYFPSLSIANYAPVCELAVDGGSLSFNGNVALGARTNLLTLTHGAAFGFAGGQWNGFGPSDSVTQFSMDEETSLSLKAMTIGDNHTIRFTGGTITPADKNLFSGAGTARFELKDTTLSRDAEVTIVMQESSVFSAENTALSDTSKFTVKTTGDARIELTGGSLATPLMAGADGAAMNLKGTTVDVGNWGLSNSSVTMDGGSFGTDGQFYFSGNGSSYVLTNVTGVTKIATCAIGGSTVTFAADSLDRKLIATGKDHAQIGNVGGQEGVLNVESGTFEFRPSGNANRFNLGHGTSTATGRLNVTGGRFVSKVTTDGATRQFGLGITHGTGFITVSGGEVDVSGLCICTEENATAPESAFRQTGGLVKVAGCAYQSTCQSFGLCATGNGKTTRKARIALDGGVTETSVIAGGTSGRCRGGTGWTAFEADGGFVRVNYANAEILRDFDEATIGAKGLTVDGNGYDLTVRQGLRSKTGAAGWLRLTGAGKKTVTGANALAVVADGGTVEFAATADNSAVDFTGTNGVALAFAAGGAKNRQFQSLVLGDDTHAAVLNLAAGESLATTGDVTVRKLSLVLSGTFATGESYTLVTCGGTLSDDSKTAWQRALVSGLADDQGCDLTAEESDGTWLLKMSVRARETKTLSADAGATRTVTDDTVYATTDKLLADVGTKGTLTVTGFAGNGALEKTGTGRAVFDNPSDFFAGGVTVMSGLLGLPYAEIFASPDLATATLTVGAGTLELGRSGAAPAELAAKFAVSTTQASDAAVVKCDSDIAVTASSAFNGCLVKRGLGTFALRAGGTCAFSSNAGKDVKNSAPPASAVTFDDFGTPPQSNYSSLTVAEGDLVLQGTAASAKYTMGGNGAVYVGMPVSNIAKPARLLVDGVTAEFKGAHFHVGSSVRTTNCSCPDSAFIVTNGAQTTVTSLRLGWGSNQSGKPYVRVTGEGTSLTVTEYFYLADSTYPNATEDNPPLLVTDGATLRMPKMNDGNANHALSCSSQKAFGVLDGATLEGADGNGARITVSSSNAQLVFRNGTLCKVDEVRVNNDTSDLTMTFDDAEWSFGTLTLTRPERITVKARGRGLVLNAPPGETKTFALPVTGEGGLVKTGEGTLVLSAAPTCTGVCRIEAGDLQLASGLTASGLTIAGPGKLTGGTFAGCTLYAPLGDAGAVTGAVPVVSGATFTGRTRVDLAHADAAIAEPFPQNVLVATYEGAAPDVSNWRPINTGVKGLSGSFKAENGEIRMSLEFHGIVFVVR